MKASAVRLPVLPDDLPNLELMRAYTSSLRFPSQLDTVSAPEQEPADALV